MTIEQFIVKRASESAQMLKRGLGLTHAQSEAIEGILSGLMTDAVTFDYCYQASGHAQIDAIERANDPKEF